MLTLAIAWLVIRRTDPRLVGIGQPDLYASLLVLHRTGGGPGSERLHRGSGCQAMGGGGYRDRFGARCRPVSSTVQRSPYAKYGMDYSQVADLITVKAAPGDCLLVNDTVTFIMPAPMRPLLAARPDAYRKLIDLSLWQRATDRNHVFDTNLIPEATAGPLSNCRVVWIITQADPSVPAHEQDPKMPPGPLFGGTPFGFRGTSGSGSWSAGSSTLFRSSRRRADYQTRR